MDRLVVRYTQNGMRFVWAAGEAGVHIVVLWNGVGRRADTGCLVSAVGLGLPEHVLLERVPELVVSVFSAEAIRTQRDGVVAMRAHRLLIADTLQVGGVQVDIHEAEAAEHGGLHCRWAGKFAHKGAFRNAAIPGVARELRRAPSWLKAGIAVVGDEERTDHSVSPQCLDTRAASDAKH